MDAPQIITVRSSAGAGKTYNLAQYYLKLLVVDQMSGGKAGDQISNIVALTFTNKAAAEMRARIIDWMKRIILDIHLKGSSRTPLEEILKTAESDQLSAPIIDHRSSIIGHRAMNGRPEAESIRTKVRRAIEADFEDILRYFYDFNVGTIDSFVNLILKASAFKLNLPPDFDISTDSAPLIDLVIQECLQSLTGNTEARRIFDRFIESYIDMEGENVNWTARGFFKGTIKDLWREESKENKEFLYRDAGKALSDAGKRIDQAAASLRRSLDGDPDIKVRADLRKALSFPVDLRKNTLSESKYFARRSLGESLLKGSKLPDAAQENLWQDIIRGRCLFVETLSEGKYAPYVEAYGLFKRMLLREVTFRKRVVLIEQLNKLLQGIIRKKGFVPEIYYALAERYSHFLVDEFQDTNQLQWQNIEVLAEEALGRGGTLFLVGDKKQAIYRWRGGNAELIDEVSSRYQAYRVRELTLRNNYRSGGHIITFNNTIFGRENLQYLIDMIAGEHPQRSKEKILDTYRGSGQIAADAAHGAGYVRIERIVGLDEEGDEKDSFLKDERDRLVRERLVQVMRAIKDGGVFEYKDVAILVRRRKEAELIVRTLLETGIGVESEFTVNIKNNSLVKELLSLMRFFNAPDDDLSFAEFVTGRIFRSKTAMSEGAISEWLAAARANSKDNRLYKIFQRDRSDIWDRYFEYFFKRTGYLPLYDLFTLIVKRWEVFKHFPEDTPYILHLCELIKAQEGSGMNNLSDFLELCTRASDAAYDETAEVEKQFLLNTTEGANAVKVLTVHKAKGLQFPVVILPFLKLTTFGSSDSRDKNKIVVSGEGDLKLFYIKKSYRQVSRALEDIYLQREGEFLLDELNSTYVACTRAEKELYIFLADSVKQKNFLIDYIFSVEELKSCSKGAVIEIGRHAELPPGSAAGDRPGTMSKELRLDDMGDHIGWTEMFRTKFIRPETVSRRSIAAQVKGDLIHYILSQIHTLPHDPLPQVRGSIQTGIAKLNAPFSEEEIEEVIVRLLLDPQVLSFFQPEKGAVVFTEKEIIDSGGSAFKVDRLIIYPSRLDVVDFKTGGTRSGEHIDQIKRYGRLLQLIHQDKEVNKYLVYVDDRSVIKV
jgi:ATP-dependent exoDNAse (exonuclease V) beta subunit